MKNEDLPLLQLFTKLREAGLPLGIAEYQLLLKALQQGFGIPDHTALRRLCLTLWITSKEDIELFDYHFEKIILEDLLSSSLRNRETPEPLSLDSSQVSNPQLEQTISSTESTTTPSEFIRDKDEVQVAQAVRLAHQREKEFSLSYFTSTDEYFPVTRRQMKQSWRYLRRLVREGPVVDLDLEATVNQIGKQGMLLHPVLCPRRVNRTQLLLLIDRDGSMVPFHSLSERLVETALGGGRLGEVKVYYFHNCPVDYLYHDPHHLKAEKIDNILPILRSDRTSILMVSDGGAARGGLNLERVEITQEFLSQLRQKVRYIAWLNPMPKSRWRGTTAQDINHFIPMFEFTRQGLDGVIKFLRGQGSNFQNPR